MLKVLLAVKECESYRHLFEGHSVTALPEDSAPSEAVRKRGFDVAIIGTDLEELKKVKRNDPRVSVIVFGDSEVQAIDAVKEGACACFPQPVDGAALRGVLGRIEKDASVRREIYELEKLIATKFTFQGIVGRNPRILEVLNFLVHIAPYWKTVAIVGETGTGKELFARALHSMGPVSKHPFMAFNCGAVTETLINSELFGHRKGAFTGAVEEKVGLFEASGEGALFLDEITSLPPSVQPNLLRVLQDGEFRKVGSNQSLKARCRVIAASNRDLAGEVREGKLREDLFFRLTPITIHVPPLRERKDDVPLLLRHFIDRFRERTGKEVRGISREAQALLLSYDWPGNVRELENIIERAAILTTQSFIRAEDLPAEVRRGPHGREKRSSGNSSLDEVIKAHIEEVLRSCGGNRTQASKLLRISRRSLLRKIEKYSLK